MLFKISPLQILIHALQKECKWLILKNWYINQLNQHVKAAPVFCMVLQVFVKPTGRQPHCRMHKADSFLYLSVQLQSQGKITIVVIRVAFWLVSSEAKKSISLHVRCVIRAPSCISNTALQDSDQYKQENTSSPLNSNFTLSYISLLHLLGNAEEKHFSSKKSTFSF